MKSQVRLAILAMGFSGLVAEIFLVREFLIVFAGNEFSIGIVLAHWLILEAGGAFWLGKIVTRFKHQLETFSLITILFFVFLFIAVFLIRTLKNTLGVSIGESIGFVPMFYSSFLILAPVSVLHGALFTSSCQIYSMFSNQDTSLAGKVYAYETIGTLIGGIVCTYLLIPHLDTFQTFAWLALLNLIICLGLLASNWNRGSIPKAISILSSGLIVLSVYLIFGGLSDKLHHDSIQAQWKNLNVVHYQNSPYGNICVVENEGQYIFFQDGIAEIITPIPDIPSVEEFVHLPLLAHPEPKKLFILSGGVGGVINEALKHPTIEIIEYAELDPLLITLFNKFPTPLTESELKNHRVKIEHVDGRLWLKTTRNQYDVIFIGIGEPSNLQTNRFFTHEFFALAKVRLAERGILVFELPGSLTFVNEELKNLNSSIFHTVSSVFAYVRVIPGDGANIFLASDSRDIITLDRRQIIERLNARNIATNVLIPWYIEQKVHPGWQVWLSNFLKGSSQKINSDFNPIGVFYSIAHWNALYAPSLRWLFKEFERASIWIGILLLGAFLLYFVARAKNSLQASIPFAIITTGFAGMIFDLILIFAFQAIYGYVFSWIGILVAAFMAGAACGAMLITMTLERTQKGLAFFAKIELAIIGFSIGCPALILAAHTYVGNPDVLFLSQGLFLGLSFIGGLLTGSQFPLANHLYLANQANVSQTAGLLYASDLIGGWVGGIIGAVVLLPVLGLVGTCVTVTLLKVLSLVTLVVQLSVRR
jgi:spermidine synthase